MTRIIAIVVVIAAAVVAYMYTSAGDVEVGSEVEATAAEPAGNNATAEETTLPHDVALEEDEALEEEAEVLDDTLAEELQEEAVEEELLEGDLDATELDEATSAEVLDDTAETVPGEEGPADEEPDSGVGAVSTEEETDGAGVEGITAEPGEQDGLAGAIPEEGIDASQTPEGLDTTNDNAPEAVMPGEEVDVAETQAEAAEQADEVGDAAAEAAGTDVGAAVIADPGPAIRIDATEAPTSGRADLEALLDPATLDVEEVTAAIEASDIEPERQAQLVEALETAQDSPVLLSGVLDRIRTALSGD